MKFMKTIFGDFFCLFEVHFNDATSLGGCFSWVVG
jgi:hypothetical protein